MTQPSFTSHELADPLSRATSLRWDERTLTQLFGHDEDDTFLLNWADLWAAIEELPRP